MAKSAQKDGQRRRYWADENVTPATETPGSTLYQAGRYNLSMRITRSKVIDGQIVVEGESLAEGSFVTVLVSDERTFTLSHEEEAALLEAIAEADRGNLLDADDVLQADVRQVDPDLARGEGLDMETGGL